MPKNAHYSGIMCLRPYLKSVCTRCVYNVRAVAFQEILMNGQINRSMKTSLVFFVVVVLYCIVCLFVLMFAFFNTDKYS